MPADKWFLLSHMELVLILVSFYNLNLLIREPVELVDDKVNEPVCRGVFCLQRR